MEFILFRFFALLSVVCVASHAADVSSEDYWRSVLPNTPMPKFINQLLQSPAAGTINKDGHRNYGAFGADGIIDIIVGHDHYATAAGSVKNKNGHRNYGSFGAGGIIDITVINRGYSYSANADYNIDGDFYFLEKDLQRGTNMNIHFTKFTTPTPFLPRNVADSIPFSSEKLPEILNEFSVKQNTLASKIMKRTIDNCEAPAYQGEEKYCATSLENMIDFTTSRLGKKVNAVSTDVEKEGELQEYRILGSKKIGENTVVCHKQNYAHAVFYCHKLNNVEAYAVSLVGNDGTKVKAPVICHMDTSSWNPKHIAFQILHVNPGADSVCHFLETDCVLWVSY